MSDSEEAESDLASDIPTTEDEDMFEDEVFSNSLESGSSAPTSPITLDTARSQYYQTTFDIETPEMDFVPLESNIARIAGHTYQEQAIVYDPASNREVPEADALSMIDYLLVTVVLEQGLEFLKDWSGHLQVPTLDLEQLLTSELNIQNLANMLSENKGRAGEFHKHLAAKLEACLPSLATKDAVRVDAGAKMLAEIPQLAESDDGKFDLEAARRRLTDLLSGGDQEAGEGGGEPEDNSIYRGPHVDVPLVLDDESWKRLLSLAEAARTAVARQQAGVDEEDVRFLALLTAIEYGAPPAASVPPFVHNVAVRSKNAALHVRRCTADIRDKVASAASDYLSYLEDPSLPTVMDFDDLLTHLRHTCQIIASLPLLNIVVGGCRRGRGGRDGGAWGRGHTGQAQHCLDVVQDGAEALFVFSGGLELLLFFRDCLKLWKGGNAGVVLLNSLQGPGDTAHITKGGAQVEELTIVPFNGRVPDV